MGIPIPGLYIETGSQCLPNGACCSARETGGVSIALWAFSSWTASSWASWAATSVTEAVKWRRGVSSRRRLELRPSGVTAPAPMKSTLYMLNFFPGSISIYLQYHSSTLAWHCWNPFSCKTRTYLFYINSIMGADVLATRGARASATMILTMLHLNNSVPTH